jgi:hypothetical protein
MMMYNYGRRDDSRFIAMMRDFTKTYAGRSATTDDFQAIVSKHFGQDMSWFFNQWIHGTELPKITVEYRLKPVEKGMVLEGKIAQTGVNPAFKTVLPFLAAFGQNVGSGQLVVIGASSPFSIPMPAMPDRVEFNPLRAVLCDLEIKKL